MRQLRKVNGSRQRRARRELRLRPAGYSPSVTHYLKSSIARGATSGGRPKRKNPHEGGPSILTLLLIGVGGYFLWNWWQSLSTPVVTTTTPGATTGTITTPTSLVTTPINTNAGTTTTGSSTAAPVVSLTSTIGQDALNALASQANNPGNKALSPNGGQTYSGYQWDAMAKVAYGNQYLPMSSLPSISGGSQYTIQQYVQAYVNGLQSMPGLNGLGCAGCPSRGMGCNSCTGMGAVSNTQLMYRKMAARSGRGFAVGDFADTKAMRSESNWVN